MLTPNELKHRNISIIKHHFEDLKPNVMEAVGVFWLVWDVAEDIGVVYS